MGSEERDAMDRLLDGVLTRYSSEEPRPGLERRVLDRIHAAGARRRFVLPHWALPIPVLACLFATIAVWSHRRPAPRPPEVVETVAERSQPALAPVEDARPIPKQRRPAPRVARRLKPPRQAEFPIPRPLTNEERALMALVGRAPEQAREAFRETSREGVQPIRIEEIQIQPLQSGGGNQ